MLNESLDEEQIIARVAALDIGKAELVCCVRVPGVGGANRSAPGSVESEFSRQRVLPAGDLTVVLVLELVG
jgi:hypothetical protein